MTHKSEKAAHLAHLREDIYFRIKPSKIHGVGIFAIKKIPKGTNPFNLAKPIEWIKYNRSELTKLPKHVKKIVSDFYAGDKKSVWLPALGLNVFDISFYINHSDNPNMISADGGENFVAARNIRAGEELTSDYNTYY
ncbi:MAG: SET domain-containing protein [bacterium]|nr:SET domain-containing protein [bacterium]